MPITEDELGRMERQVRNLSMVGYDVATITVLADQKRLIDEVRRLNHKLEVVVSTLDYIDRKGIGFEGEIERALNFAKTGSFDGTA